jgi:hypothetical protein
MEWRQYRPVNNHPKPYGSLGAFALLGFSNSDGVDKLQGSSGFD